MKTVDQSGGVNEIATAEGAREVGVQILDEDLLGSHRVRLFSGKKKIANCILAAMQAGVSFACGFEQVLKVACAVIMLAPPRTVGRPLPTELTASINTRTITQRTRWCVE